MTGSARYDAREDTPAKARAYEGAQGGHPGRPLFAGPGEMRTRCRAIEWAATPLGPIERWPRALRTAIDLCLDSCFPMCVFCGPELILVYNDRFAEVLGAAKHPWALGRPAHEVWAEDWERVEPEFRQALGGAAVWHEDERFLISRSEREDEAFFTYSLSPVRADDGVVLGVLSVLTETTERMRLVTALDLERSRLADVFRQAPVAITVLRGRVAADLVYELVNPRYLELIPPGRAPLGRRLRDVLPEIEEVVLRVLQRVLDTGEPFVASDFPVSLDRDGDGTPETYYFNFVYHPRVEADGSVAGVVGVGTEVTESVRARREIEAIYDSAPVGLCVLDRDLRFLRINERLAEINGVPAKAHVGRTVREVLPELADIAEPMLRRVLETGEPALDVEISGETPARPGVTRTWVEQWLPIRDPGGAVVGINVVAQEVTDQRQAATERERLLDAERAARTDAEASRAEAEAANRAKSEFLAVMSHELRTPLNAIDGYAELMEMELRGPVTAQQREDLRRIRQSQKHLLGLINQVLNYTRVETGTVRYDLTDVPVDQALALAEALVVPQVRAKGLEYAFSRSDPSLTVRADHDKLQQILLNLLSNAVKFTDAGGRITVSCTRRDSVVAIAVADTGIGIAADKLPNIFEPFVQVDQRLTRPHEGVGLGLAISRDLARGMGGDLTAASTPDEGSVFTLVLPRAS